MKKKMTMKKWFQMVLVFTFFLGCQPEAPPGYEEEPSQPEESGYEVTIMKMDRSSSPYYEPEERDGTGGEGAGPGDQCFYVCSSSSNTGNIGIWYVWPGPPRDYCFYVCSSSDNL